jgi:hypothetical protein
MRVRRAEECYAGTRATGLCRVPRAITPVPAPRTAMLAAFLLVAAYLGFVAVGSPHMDPPPKPSSAKAVPAPGPISVASSRDEGTVRPAER